MPPEANPSEWILEIIGAAGTQANQDYYEIWKNSSEYREVNNELDRMEQGLIKIPKDDSKENMQTYAVPLWYQYIQVTTEYFNSIGGHLITHHSQQNAKKNIECDFDYVSYYIPLLFCRVYRRAFFFFHHTSSL